MNWRKHKITFEDVMLTIVLVALAVVLLYWLVGCSSVHRTATLRYKSNQTCEWRLTGLEAIRAEQIGTELEVGEDCTLSRKADAAVIQEKPQE